MKKCVRTLGLCLILAAGLTVWSGLRDRQALSTRLIRMHVVASSDSREDQSRKLQVRDAVLRAIDAGLRDAGDMQKAEQYLRENLPRIQAAAEDTLKALGCSDPVEVTLCRETFPRRDYETFSLPGGIYESLRIRIGEGKGHNWWCVAFPSLCLPAAGEDIRSVAAQAGLPPELTDTITGDRPLRFYFLDLLGHLEILAGDR